MDLFFVYRSFKHNLSTKQASPGPSQYNSTDIKLYKNKPPTYTMSPQVFPPNQKGYTPGPIYLQKLPKKPGTDTDPYITAEDDMPCIQKQKKC